MRLNVTFYTFVVILNFIFRLLSLIYSHLFFSFGILFFLTTTVLAQPNNGSSEDPFQVNVAYTGEYWGNLSGGTETGTRYLDNIDVNLEIDFGALPLGFTGTTLYFYGLGNQGGSISELSGDLQGISNIETENSWRLFEVWVQKKFFLAHSSVLLGLYDINSEFNVLNSSLLFINSSHGIDPTLALSGVLGPSTFPYTSMAGRIKVNPAGGLVLQAALLDGIPSNPGNPSGNKVFFRERDGLLFLGEVGYYSVGQENLQLRNRTVRLQHLLGRNAEAGRYKFAIGGWAYSKKREGWLPDETEVRDMGIYGIGEYRLFQEPETVNQGLTLFARASIADEKVNRLAGYLGAGLVYRGLIEGRGQDDAGVAVANASNSQAYQDQQFLTEGIRPEKAETNIEITYLAVLTSSVSLQADFQYIVNPNTNPDISNALALGARLLLSF